MAKFTLKQYESFLKNINLDSYRERFSKIKTVEMDLPKSIQALQTIYEQYWQNKDNLKEPLSFDEYYELYWQTHEQDILDFWSSTGFGKDCDCFKKGLKARIYRTWASLITQIQGGYVAETVFGEGCVKMGTELDYKDIDILITNKDGTDRLKIQIKKETHRSEIARMQRSYDEVNNGVVYVYYIVPTQHDYENPKYVKNGKDYKNGDEKPFVKSFAKWYPETATLDRLDNGFVIFTRNAFLGLE
ncbi:TaqI family restriction endonuclease [Candidatus Saccharibacteria bacterium]|nr:TaqI family restriction endonuclease [Candidatus Saccharibacteria bacterium]